MLSKAVIYICINKTVSVSLQIFIFGFWFVKSACLLCFYYGNILTKWLSSWWLMEWSRVHCSHWERGQNIHEMRTREPSPPSHPVLPVAIHWKILGGDSGSCLLDFMSGMAEPFPFLIHLTTADGIGGYKIAFALKLAVVIEFAV